MKEKKKKKLYEEMDQLRNADSSYDALVWAVEGAVQKFITKKNTTKSYKPYSSKRYSLNVTVKAVPVTAEQMKTLKKYLKIKYCDELWGDRISIKKRWFRELYKITSF